MQELVPMSEVGAVEIAEALVNEGGEDLKEDCEVALTRQELC